MGFHSPPYLYFQYPLCMYFHAPIFISSLNIFKCNQYGVNNHILYLISSIRIHMLYHINIPFNASIFYRTPCHVSLNRTISTFHIPYVIPYILYVFIPYIVSTSHFFKFYFLGVEGESVV